MIQRPRRAPLVVLAALAAGFTAGCPHHDATDAVPDAAVPRRPIGPQRVTFTTSDGWTLVGDLWSPVDAAGGRNAGVLLVHQLGSSRREWAGFIARARGAHPRWTFLAVDLRGHGESTRGPDGETRWTTFDNDPAKWSGLVDDVARAADYLRGATYPPSVYIVGSSIGGSATIRYASDPRSYVGGVVLISPGLAYHGLDTLAPMAAYARSSRPALFIASDGDADAAAAVAAFMDGPAHGHARIESQVYAGTGAHGVSIGAPGVHPELWDRVATAIDGWTALRAAGAEPVGDGDGDAAGASDGGNDAAAH